ncbi:MAG: hypothetical protein H6581_18090 [Bacteroidia bacterium]|nr:hypothetical protein [Bacteroidia bacterium]
MTILTACGSQTDSKGPKWTDDTLETQTPKTIDPDDLTQVLPDQQEMNFETRVREVTQKLFSTDFKEDRIDVMEETPRWSNSKKSVFKKYLRQQTIANEYGNKIYIRPIFKAWEFKSEADMRTTLSDWLNGHESSDPDQIELGENVEALKSPPFVCAIRNQEIYMIFSACVFSGEAWDNLKKAFWDEFSQKGTLYLFEVACGAGTLTYLQTPETSHEI